MVQTYAFSDDQIIMAKSNEKNLETSIAKINLAAESSSAMLKRGE